MKEINNNEKEIGLMEIGYSHTHFVYFWTVSVLPIHEKLISEYI